MQDTLMYDLICSHGASAFSKTATGTIIFYFLIMEFEAVLAWSMSIYKYFRIKFNTYSAPGLLS